MIENYGMRVTGLMGLASGSLGDYICSGMSSGRGDSQGNGKSLLSRQFWADGDDTLGYGHASGEGELADDSDGKGHGDGRGYEGKGDGQGDGDGEGQLDGYGG